MHSRIRGLARFCRADLKFAIAPGRQRAMNVSRIGKKMLMQTNAKANI
jgi:hypothetical protein